MAAHRQSGQETERAHHQPKYDAASIQAVHPKGSITPTNSIATWGPRFQKPQSLQNISFKTGFKTDFEVIILFSCYFIIRQNILQVEDERVYSGSQSVMVGKTWQEVFVQLVTVQTLSGSKERIMLVLGSVSTIYSAKEPKPWNRVFLPQLRQSRNSFIDIPRNLYPRCFQTLSS